MLGFKKLGQRLTLPGFTLVPSALVVLTALFGMGRGGPHRHSRLKIFKVISLKLARVGMTTFHVELFTFHS